MKKYYFWVWMLAMITIGSVIFFLTRGTTIVSGYIYNQKGGTPLKDSKFEINSTFTNKQEFKTDKNGFFEIRTVKGEHYNITGKKLENEIYVKKQNVIKIKNKKGYVSLGKEVKEKGVYAKFKPSVKVIEDEVNYSVNEGDSSIILEKKYDIKKMIL